MDILLHLRDYTTIAGKFIEVLALEHRGGESTVWQTGDEGTLDRTLAAWRSCGARLALPGERRFDEFEFAAGSELGTSDRDVVRRLFAVVEHFPKTVALLATVRALDQIRPEMREEIEKVYPEIADDADWIASNVLSGMVAQVAEMFEERGGGHA